MENITNPGINPKAKFEHFSETEFNIIKKMSSEWYITNGGGIIKHSHNIEYKYFLMKPAANYSELFNIEREIITVFSNYKSFEPRTLEVFETVIKKHQDLRIEKVCSVLVSSDSFVETKIKDLLKSDSEYQVIIPFTYSEVAENTDPYFIRTRFKEFFYTRDLFAFQSPLKKDLYFFGRNDLVHKIINRHRSNENSGLFGLRKTGKTSVIFGIQRAIKTYEGTSVFIDCQSPSFHIKRWNTSLHYIINEIKEQNNIQILLKPEEEYTEENAAKLFEKEIFKIYKKLNKGNILIIFDEIEQISFDLSPTKHWKNGTDFILFWQTLRSCFQKLENVFSYLIVGTNPKGVETATINKIDNPIFNQIPYEYIPAFEVSQTREMVRKLGKIMGLNFDEIIYSKLTEDFGGHPFLIRTVCSIINKIAPKERPTRIDKILYEQGKTDFGNEYSTYIEMILVVLKEYYNDEFEMLRMLAIGNSTEFNEFANISKDYTNHLLGYNIIDKNNNIYHFKIEFIQKYLEEKNKFKRLNLSQKEIRSEISERRNDIEIQIREICRSLLIVKYGPQEAKSKVLNIFGEPRKTRLSHLAYKDLFNPNKGEIYYEDVRKLINKDWDLFKNVFNNNLEKFNSSMNTMNIYRKPDAHAAEITETEFNLFRAYATDLENQIEEFTTN